MKGLFDLKGVVTHRLITTATGVCYLDLKRRNIRADEMAQWEKILAAKHDLNLVPGTHMIGENRRLQVTL